MTTNNTNDEPVFQQCAKHDPTAQQKCDDDDNGDACKPRRRTNDDDDDDVNNDDDDDDDDDVQRASIIRHHVGNRGGVKANSPPEAKALGTPVSGTTGMVPHPSSKTRSWVPSCASPNKTESDERRKGPVVTKLVRTDLSFVKASAGVRNVRNDAPAPAGNSREPHDEPGRLLPEPGELPLPLRAVLLRDPLPCLLPLPRHDLLDRECSA